MRTDIHREARTFVIEAVESHWKQLRYNNLNADDDANWPVHDIKRTVRKRLQATGRYGSVELWIYVAFTLAKLIWEIIRERRGAAWGGIGHA